MKTLALAAMALGVLGATQMMNAKPAAAQIEYPYCKQGSQQGYPGNCSFSTFESCRYSAQGTGGNCVANPRYIAWGGGYGREDGYGPSWGPSAY